MEIFGPVPSRRLGMSLGINNIPPKVCSYSCLYCQVGKGDIKQITRQAFYEPDYLVDKVKSVLSKITDKQNYPDYLTIVPDGEPTLDINLRTLIDKLKLLKIPVAVITNASLINTPDVREDLLKTDYVSIKSDSFNSTIWKKINVPYKTLNLQDILQGIHLFSNEFQGNLVTETMLLKGINDTPEDLLNTAQTISTFNPDTAFISVPTRPTAYKKAAKPDEGTVTMAYEIFSKHIKNVELLTGYEGNAFASSGNFTEDILSITAVHPMREDAVMLLLNKSGKKKDVLLELIADNQIEKINYRGENYYLRRFSK